MAPALCPELDKVNAHFSCASLFRRSRNRNVFCLLQVTRPYVYVTLEYRVVCIALEVGSFKDAACFLGRLAGREVHLGLPLGLLPHNCYSPPSLAGSSPASLKRKKKAGPDEESVDGEQTK